MTERNEELLNLVKGVADAASDIARRQEEVTNVSSKLRVRRLENHFTADIEKLLRGE